MQQRRQQRGGASGAAALPPVAAAPRPTRAIRIADGSSDARRSRRGAGWAIGLQPGASAPPACGGAASCDPPCPCSRLAPCYVVRYASSAAGPGLSTVLHPPAAPPQNGLLLLPVTTRRGGGCARGMWLPGTCCPATWLPRVKPFWEPAAEACSRRAQPPECAGASCSARAGAMRSRGHAPCVPPALHPLSGGKQQQYAWDGTCIKPVNLELLEGGYTPAGE
jgi:hypothetical protein